MRVIGLDFGLKRIGVAVSDEGGRLAQPLKVISASAGGKKVMEELGLIISEYSPEVAVVGDPRSPDGSEGKLGKMAREFADSVGSRFGLKIVMQDERYSSFEAEEKLREAGARNWRARKKRLDRAAAAVILQDYLDQSMGGRR